MGLFTGAIADLGSHSTSTPRSFNEYKRAQGYPQADTAASISVDSLSRLDSELRSARAMVFRLGSPVGTKGTQFALAKYVSDWSDYFLDDERLAEGVATEEHHSGNEHDLLAFQLLPALTEVSVVNLALASGLLGCALGIEDPSRPIIPATGQSTFSFSVRPHADYQVVWEHDNGQIELDAVFVARRGVKKLLFVVEAKCGECLGTLAKHKLVYPLLALRQSIPEGFEIVPVYLRVLKLAGQLQFRVTECRVNESENQVVAISSLIPLRTCIRTLRGFGSIDSG